MQERRRFDRQIGIWLLVCCGMIFCMVMLGGVTRLTRSGLSMVTWKPLRGVIPPLNKAQWEKEFSRYKQFPEYKLLNQSMSLKRFKSIFWMEYSHRVWGRLIGIVFLFPFLWFLFRRRLRKGLVPRLTFMFIGGGLQGLVGWYMVKSGLVSKPHVSQYRLVIHLMLAFGLYAYILWVALGLLFPPTDASPPDNAEASTEDPDNAEASTEDPDNAEASEDPDSDKASTSTEAVADAAPSNTGAPDAALQRLRRLGWFVTATLTVMIISGGFVAGLRAGHVYNTFPLMGGQLIPSGLFAYQPWYFNFFENVLTVQFTHRSIAYFLCILIPLYVWLSRKHDLQARCQRTFWILLALLAAQVTLGILTLLNHVPVSLGATHQMGALCLFTVSIILNHQLSQPTP